MGKKEMDANELKLCIENDDFSLKYTLCGKSRDHILNKFYFDIEQSKINQMVQEETDQHIKQNEIEMNIEDIEKLKQEKEIEIKKRIQESKQIEISEKGY